MKYRKTKLTTVLLTATSLLFTGCSSNSSQESVPSQNTSPSFYAEEKPSNDEKINAEVEKEAEDERPVVVHPDDEFPGLLMGDAGPDLETSWLPDLNLTGDYMADLENVGFSYESQEHLELLFEIYDDKYCAHSLTEPVNRMSLLGYLEGDFSRDKGDFARTYVAYNCPGRAETIDRLFIYIEVNQD